MKKRELFLSAAMVVVAGVSRITISNAYEAIYVNPGITAKAKLVVSPTGNSFTNTEDYGDENLQFSENG